MIRGCIDFDLGVPARYQGVGELYDGAYFVWLEMRRVAATVLTWTWIQPSRPQHVNGETQHCWQSCPARFDEKKKNRVPILKNKFPLPAELRVVTMTGTLSGSPSYDLK